jgi:3-deoxy-7-phosphoheptulonate synthase
MIVVLSQTATAAEIDQISRRIKRLGCDVQHIDGEERSVLAVVGTPQFSTSELSQMSGVAQVMRIGRPYKLASREVRRERSCVKIGSSSLVGGEQVVVMAGPGLIENAVTLSETATHCIDCGVMVLRVDAFATRDSPYAFAGLGSDAFEHLMDLRENTALSIVSEAASVQQVEALTPIVDGLRIDGRQMNNEALLRAAAGSGLPIILERAPSATVDEWLYAAELLLATGAEDRVILCERGIRSFEPSTPDTLDLSSIVVVNERSHLPILVDPSLGTGTREYVAPMARAAVAAGADGVIVQVHPRPQLARSGGARSLYFDQLRALVRELQTIAPVVGRRLDLTTTRPLTVARRDHAADVAYQGEPGAFSEQAARQVFEGSYTLLPCQSFRKTFEAVVTGQTRYGIVPVENTLGGSIPENFDLLREFDVAIVGETRLRVVHNLIANRGVTLDAIRKIYAHPQAAAQCDKLIRQHPEWTVYQVYDTAGSVKMIRDEGVLDGAGIARADVADALNMEIVASGIESHPQNFTRFLVFAKPGRFGTGCNKASLVYVTHDRPGALMQTLKVFAQHGMNLTRLESRPVPGSPWIYRFYVDVEGEATQQMLEELLPHVVELKVLGEYPSA